MRIELLGVSPLVWRRVVVSDGWTLAELHVYLQWVMGWQDEHAHEFEYAEQIAGPEWWIQEIGADEDAGKCVDEKKVLVRDVLARLNVTATFDYRYDMGDGWEHRIYVESLPRAWSTQHLPMGICTAGENACPPDNVGGPAGYEEFLESLADPNHPNHEDMLDWICGVFDPKGFDLNRVNRSWLEMGHF